MQFFDLVKHAALAESLRDFKDFSRKFVLYPKQWVAYPNRVPSLKWQRTKFDDTIKTVLPKDKGGIYSFILEPQIADHASVGYLLYVGKAEKDSLCERCTSYLYECNKAKGRILIQDMLRLWPEHLWLHYVPVDNRAIISQLEGDLIEAFVPPFNDDFPATISRQARNAYR